MQISGTAPALDIFTVKVMTLVTTLVVSFATLLAWRVNRRVPGMQLFSLGLISISFGAILGIGRLVIAGDLILVACNIFMLGGMLLVAQGIRVFRGFPPLHSRAIAAFVVATACVFLYWLFVHDVFANRVSVISAGFSLLTADAAVSMLRKTPPRDRLVYLPTGLAFAFAALYSAGRSIMALSGAYGTSLLSPAPMEIAATICADIAFTSCAFGMLLASNSQLRYEAEKLALYDPLTNLPNRRLLLDRLLAAEERALASGQSLGVIYVDLDGFKAVNDTQGHEAGDELLRKVGRSMSRALKTDGFLARMGGDEFVVIVEHLESRSQIQNLTERLRQAVESHPIAASFGSAVFPEDGLKAHDVMREADAAMYHAKRRSRMPSQPVVG